MCDGCSANGVKHLNDEFGLIRRCPACMSSLCAWAPAAATLALSAVQCLANHVHMLAIPDSHSASRHPVCAQASSSSHRTANRLKSWFPPRSYFASSLSLLLPASMPHPPSSSLAPFLTPFPPYLPSLPTYLHSLPLFPSSLPDSSPSLLTSLLATFKVL